ncbi:hypothetical protein ACS0TY_008712 [Phlomoides rotata]
MAGQTPNMEQFEAYFQRADLDRDGRISGNEAVTFLQASNLPRQVLAQIWTFADQNHVGFLGRSEFYNALKLVTVAQSKLDLTPELVKAALYGPASSKIPAPQINLAQLGGPPSSAQSPGVSSQQVLLPQQNPATRPPRPLSPSPAFQSHPAFASQGMPGTSSMSASTDGSRAGVSSQVPNRNLLPPANRGNFGQMASPITQNNAPEATSSQVGKEDTGSLSTKGNGFAADSVFGDVFSAALSKPQLNSNALTPSQPPQISVALTPSQPQQSSIVVTPSQPKQNSTALTYPISSIPVSSTGNMTQSREQPAMTPSAAPQPPNIQAQQFPSTGKPNQHGSTQKPPVFPVASRQSQPPWPKMTPSDVQKYSKVFVQVDTDRDGKITGEQARNLFLSWRLPREVLKQVWDLSDQDNDSMLSLREFCFAVYLMERYREGRPLPSTLPNSFILDETLFPVSGPPVAAFNNTSWRPTPDLQQAQASKNALPTTSAAVRKPPRPIPVPQPDEPIQQKAKVPVLEKQLLDQLSTEEQDSLNKKLEDAKDAEKKVADLEKEIFDAKQKVQFYHAKMQELIIYKSQCDNRLNEISERVVADKREAESLAKKYEEKYKQTGDVASKLTIQEATFRDIQEKKMELYRSIVKLEQENADGVQDRVNQIQSELEELVKALNERCKTYGLRGKPTSLVELPFGWQPGIEGTAADWDEDWDKFEDEGFTYVKELTLEVQNVIAPPKPKSGFREQVTLSDNSATAKSPSKGDDKSELLSSGERVPENDRPDGNNSEQTARTPPDSPAGSNTFSPSKESRDMRNGSPHAFDTQSEYGAESVFSGDKRFDEPSWGSFDTHYDADAAWDSNPVLPKEADYDKQSQGSLFTPDEWGLNPIRTGSKQGPFFDSVPSTPLNQGPFFDSVPSTPLKQGSFFDSSVPSTPLYNVPSSPHTDNLFARNSTYAFADSAPSTPMYNFSSSPRGSEEQHSFDSFSRFDSFNMNDSGPFGSRDSFSRFDSMRSTRDSTDFDQGYFAQPESLARFDSFRSTADSDYNFGAFPPQPSLTRFDSMSSTRDSDYGHGFSSFDDTADPFGSGEPFRTSHEAQTPRKDSDSWKAF